MYVQDAHCPFRTAAISWNIRPGGMLEIRKPTSALQPEVSERYEASSNLHIMTIFLYRFSLIVA